MNTKETNKNGTHTGTSGTFTMSQAGAARISNLWKERQNEMPAGQQI